MGTLKLLDDNTNVVYGVNRSLCVLLNGHRNKKLDTLNDLFV